MGKKKKKDHLKLTPLGKERAMVPKEMPCWFLSSSAPHLHSNTPVFHAYEAGKPKPTSIFADLHHVSIQG